MRTKIGLGILTCAALGACGIAQDDGETIGYETRKITIVDVNRPKHFAVDVRDAQGREYDGVARSKHCNGWRSRAVVGKSYDIPFRLVRGEDGKVRAFMMDGILNDLLCGRS